jgi:hypothetical protein
VRVTRNPGLAVAYFLRGSIYVGLGYDETITGNRRRVDRQAAYWFDMEREQERKASDGTCGDGDGIVGSINLWDGGRLAGPKESRRETMKTNAKQMNRLL